MVTLYLNSVIPILDKIHSMKYPVRDNIVPSQVSDVSETPESEESEKNYQNIRLHCTLTECIITEQ